MRPLKSADCDQCLRRLGLTDKAGCSKQYTGKMVNFPDFNGGKEFVVQQNKLVDTKSILPGEEPNMSEEQTLSDFISRTFRLFPADHYGLILWDHGSIPFL